MYGGLGDDTFIVNDATDFCYENAGEGHDRVIASVTHALRANIEVLELAGTGDIRGYGNASDNLHPRQLGRQPALWPRRQRQPCGQ